MTLDQFKMGIERLRSRKTWEGGIDQIFVEILTQKVKNHSWETFKEVIDDFLGQHTKPTVGAIVEAMDDKARKTGRDLHVTKFSFVACGSCDGFGLVLMRRIERKGLGVFGCSACSNGDKQIHESKRCFKGGPLLSVDQALRDGWEREYGRKQRST